MALIQDFSTKNVLQKAKELVTQNFQWPGKDKLIFKLWFSEAIGQFRHIFKAMEKLEYHCMWVEIFSHEEILQELQRFPFSVCSNLIETRNIAAAKGRAQTVIMEPAQPRKLMNTKLSKKQLPTLILDSNPDAPSTDPILPK